ncbi:hypothetical protein [Flavobacterium sp.]|uniref:hypothetical protein n=1 Tax=Flavobacterium sp. TaxID=239 RepID=UPI002FD9B12B
MKNVKAFILMASMAFVFTSCAEDEKIQAERVINEFTTYVDSLAQVSTLALTENWSDIEEEVLTKKIDAEIALGTLDNKLELSQKFKASSDKYEAFKIKLYADIQKMEAQKAKSALRASLFKGRSIDDDRNFSWVNKDNILDTYESFVNTASENKENYTREEWDEIKMLYEALDTRKNTVEKEGLTSADNLKIAGLKVRFATFFKIHRATAKSNENANAKL